MTLRTLTALLALSVTLTGCPGEDPEETGDTDTSEGTDGGPSEYALPDGITGASGTMTVDSVTTGFTPDGNVDESCAAEFAITGADFAGDCDDCEWAMELTVTESSNTCTDLDGQLVLTEPAFEGTPILAYWPEWDGPYYTYEEVLAAGSAFEYGGANYVSFDQLINLDYYGTIIGADSFNFSDQGIDWSLAEDSSIALTDVTGDECEADFAAADLGAVSVGVNSVNDALPCDPVTDADGNQAVVFDRYTITAAQGDTVTLSVDTVADATAFDTYISVLAPSGCDVAFFDDSFDCAFEPADYQCSGGEFTAQEAGEYTVLVGSFGSCNEPATTGSYVFNTSTAAPTLVDDNVSIFDFDNTTEVTETVTIDVDLSFN